MDKACTRCGATDDPVVAFLEEGSLHYAERRCPVCGKHRGYVKKPKNQDKRPKNKYTAADLGIDSCQLCLRHKSRLGSNGTLHVHHVVEISSGGHDIPKNIWVVCTACHQLIHHQRTYLNNHLKSAMTVGQFRALMEEDKVPAEFRPQMENIFKLHEARHAG